MSSRGLIALLLVLICSFSLSGCALLGLGALLGGGGGGGGNNGGNFSNSSLSGSYAFSFSGVNQNGFFAVAGSFQANGSGKITGGTIDINSGGGIFTDQAITGTYSVSSDGQGTATLTAAAGTFDIDFVIVSTQNALVIRFDTTSTASGAIALQNSSAFSLNALAGSFAFNVVGADAPGNGNAEASAGVFTVDSSGNFTGGVQDTDDNGSVTPNVTLIAKPLAMTAPTTGRGTLAIGTRNFAYYVVDANHLKLVETDLAPALAGEAFRQSSTPISGSFAFTVAGANAGGTFEAGGIINTDGAGKVLNTSAQDVNNDGLITENSALSGNYSVAANGRGTMNLNGGTINFAIYPTTAGVLLFETDSSIVAGGTAFQQSGTLSNTSVDGNYGMNLAGIVVGSNEINSVAQFAADGAGNITGSVDFNNGGSLSSGLALTGKYSIASSGRGTADFASSFGTQSVIFYVVSGTQVLFIEVDTGLAAQGQAAHQ
ncbi:MAG: hypothetical protein WAM91_07955 [Candidatus Acidiferrales bacterium]